MEHAGSVMGQPSWLRSPDPSDFADVLLRRAGRSVPVAPNVRDVRRAG